MRHLARLAVGFLLACGTAEAPLSGPLPAGNTPPAGQVGADGASASTPGTTADGGVTVDDASVAGACSGRTAQPLDATWTISFGGRERTALVHVPTSVRADVAVPVVLNFHGFTSDASQQIALSGMNDKADEKGFVAVHPEGIQSSWNAGACCGTARADSIDDVGFVGALLDELEKRLCLDKRRVFATGMSNGGFLSHKLACNLSQRIAAVAPVAGVNGTSSCTPGRPMPVLHTHGTLDALVPYFGDFTKGFPSVRSTVADWAARNGCGDTPKEVFRNLETSCETYPNCGQGADVTLCIVQGGGHTWPGGLAVPAFGYTTYSMNATDRMWDFFEAHPLPSSP